MQHKEKTLNKRCIPLHVHLNVLLNPYSNAKEKTTEERTKSKHIDNIKIHHTGEELW
jgi:hypothetical protein